MLKLYHDSQLMTFQEQNKFRQRRQSSISVNFAADMMTRKLKFQAEQAQSIIRNAKKENLLTAQTYLPLLAELQVAMQHHFENLKLKILMARRAEQSERPVRDSLVETLKKGARALFDYNRMLKSIKEAIEINQKLKIEFAEKKLMLA